MHPVPSLHWTDEAELRAFVAARGFAHLYVAGPAGPMVAHVPLTLSAAGVRFHIARANRITPHLDGAAALASIAGDDFYVSPDWYGAPDQVPTWNYRAAEIEGTLRALDEAALIDQLDTLAAVFEATLAPKPVWTRAAMAADRFAAMLPGIRCFELRARTWRGTRKYGQNKPAAAQAALADALRAAGRPREAALVYAAGWPE